MWAPFALRRHKKPDHVTGIPSQTAGCKRACTNTHTHTDPASTIFPQVWAFWARLLTAVGPHNTSGLHLLWQGLKVQTPFLGKVNYCNSTWVSFTNVSRIQCSLPGRNQVKLMWTVKQAWSGGAVCYMNNARHSAACMQIQWLLKT